MSALTIPATVQPPQSLPVDYLSVSSLNLFSRCPEAWKRRYIDKEVSPPSGKMLLGGAAGAALNQHYGFQLERGVGLSTAEVLDEYSSEWDDRCGREEVQWGTDTAGALKDSGVDALTAYHQQIAPNVVPVSIERGFELTWADAPFALTGYLDLETADGKVCDFKMTGQRFSADKAAADLQPTVYLAARKAEGDPATGFEYHAMVRSTRKSYAEIVPALRTGHQLDLLTSRVFSIARAMEWRWRENCWSGAPSDLAWLCRSCSHSSSCSWSLAT